MKVIVSQMQLGPLIRKIQGIIPSKPSIPTLGNVLLEAIDGELVISATDLSLSVQTRLKAEVAEEGSIALPAKKFIPLILELTAPFVEIRASETSAMIHAGGSKFKIQGISKQNYPNIENIQASSKLSLPALALKELLTKTSFAAGSDENKPLLKSVFFECSPTRLTCTAADGKRLAKASLAITEQPLAASAHILPIKAVEEMIRFLDTKEEDIFLSLKDDKIGLQVGSTTLISQLLLGDYPDVSRIIPVPQKPPISLHREELSSLLRQVSLFTGESGSSVRFSFSSGALSLSAASGNVGEGNVEMAVNYQGDPLQVAFNPHYFLDILRHSKDETICLGIENPYNPGLITDSSQTVFVLMPMRVD